MESRLRRPFSRFALAVAVLCLVSAGSAPSAQSQASGKQKIDAEYTAKIKEHLQDPRITTELVDHLPASDTVPTPLKFFNRIVGTPGELTYAKDIYRYYEALDKASDRITMWSIGKTEEGRDMVLLAVADEATIKQIDKYKAMTASLTDPRKTTEEQAQQLIKTAKPIYWITSGMHSTENGGPEMLIELPYRLAVEETPFIQQIRNNVITIITPVIEVDGREKQVDTYYFNKKRRAAGEQQTLPLMYWGKYVAHDNNRDGMGQFLALTRNVTKTFLEWKPTVMHDLHEAVDLPLCLDRHRALQRADRSDHHRRVVAARQDRGDGDDQARGARRLDLRVLRRLGAELHVLHRPLAQLDRPLLRGDGLRSREPHRDRGADDHQPRVVPSQPAAADDPVGTAQQHQHPAVGDPDRAQPRREEPRDLSRELLDQEQARGGEGQDRTDLRVGDPGDAEAEGGRRRRGQRAAPAGARDSQGGRGVQGRRPSRSKAGDYVIRGDQPYRTVADMYFSVQNYAPSNPQPVRRHRLDLPVHAQPGHQADRREERARSADGRDHRRRACAGRHRRHRPGAGRRAHHRQQPGDVPLQACRRQDGGGARRISRRPAGSSAPGRSSSAPPTGPRSSRR